MIGTEKLLRSNKSGLKIAETIKGISSQGDSLEREYEQASINTSASDLTLMRESFWELEGLLQEPQTLNNILIFLCSISPETNLRLALQLALAADIPDERLESLAAQLQDSRSLESLLLEANILTQILEADGQIGVAEENLLLEAMELTGLIVPTSFLGAQFLLEELSQNLVQEIHSNNSPEKLFPETQTLNINNILIFLCSISPETNLRLVLQLALAANIPDERLESLAAQLQDSRSLESLLLEANILTQILEADGQIGVAEENLLLEAMELTGLIVPTSLSGAQFLLEALSQNLVQEMHNEGALQALLTEPPTLNNIHPVLV